MYAKVGHETLPMFIHVILDESIKRTKEAYGFLMFQFNDMKISHTIIVAHVPDEKDEMIRFAMKMGFEPYSETNDSTYLYLDLEKI